MAEENPLQDEPKEALDPSIDVDSDEYVRRRRLRSINDSRQAALEAEERGWAAAVIGQISQDQRRAYTFARTRRFLRDIRKPLERVDGAEEVFEEEPLGAWSPVPPTREEGPGESKPEKYELVGINATVPAEIAEGDTIVAVGLQFMYHAPAQFSVKWDAEWKKRYRANIEKTVTTHTTVPVSVSQRAFELAVDLADETELNLKSKDSEEYQQDYADVLENGEP